MALISLNQRQRTNPSANDLKFLERCTAHTLLFKKLLHPFHSGRRAIITKLVRNTFCVADSYRHVFMMGVGGEGEQGAHWQAQTKANTSQVTRAGSVQLQPRRADKGEVHTLGVLIMRRSEHVPWGRDAGPSEPPPQVRSEGWKGTQSGEEERRGEERLRDERERAGARSHEAYGSPGFRLSPKRSWQGLGV